MSGSTGRGMGHADARKPRPVEVTGAAGAVGPARTPRSPRADGRFTYALGEAVHIVNRPARVWPAAEAVLEGWAAERGNPRSDGKGGGARSGPPPPRHAAATQRMGIIRILKSTTLPQKGIWLGLMIGVFHDRMQRALKTGPFVVVVVVPPELLVLGPPGGLKSR